MFGRGSKSTSDVERDLSKVAAKAAQSVGDLAEKAAEVAGSAAERAEEFADSIRPKKKRHVFRKMLILGALGGAVAALVKSPLKSKIGDRIFGASAADEPEAITLPVNGSNTPPRASAGGGGEGSTGPSGPPSAKEDADGSGARAHKKAESSDPS